MRKFCPHRRLPSSLAALAANARGRGVCLSAGSVTAIVIAVTLSCGCTTRSPGPASATARPNASFSPTGDGGSTDHPTHERHVHAPGPESGREPASQGATAANPGDVPLLGDRREAEPPPLHDRMTTNLSRHTFTTDGLDFDPDIDSTGALLAFASTRNALRPDIYLKSIDGTALTQLTDHAADDIQPRFSPDGRRIAFASNRSGNWDIWVIDVDGRGLTQLTSDRTDEVAPCWSPDGKRIAYTLWGPRSHAWEIWTLSLEQPGLRTFLTHGMFPAWSPDGGRIAFQRARERGTRWFSIWTVELHDGEARHPTEIAQSHTAACIAPRWSPDGKMLVYCVVQRPEDAAGAPEPRRVPRADLWAIALESGLQRKLTDGGDAAFNPVWGRNGRVFFVSKRAGTENVWSLLAEPGRMAQSGRGLEVSQAAGERGGSP